MADQGRWWNEGRERGQHGSGDRSRRGYREYGEAYDYGSDDFERGGREPRSFGGSEFNTGHSYGDDDQGRRRSSASPGPGGYAGEGGPRGPYGRGEESYGPARYGQGGYGVEAGGSYGSRYGDYEGSQRTGEQRYGSSERYAGSQGYGGETGGHRGRGPKNYSRSDERVREDVNDRLTDDSWLDASEMEVGVSSGEVTLSGTVDSREDKRRAEDLAEQVAGVRHVQNNLRVQGRQNPGASQSGEGSTTSATPTGDTVSTGRPASSKLS
jgi:hypothetical protein